MYPCYLRAKFRLHTAPSHISAPGSGTCTPRRRRCKIHSQRRGLNIVVAWHRKGLCSNPWIRHRCTVSTWICRFAVRSCRPRFQYSPEKNTDFLFYISLFNNKETQLLAICLKGILTNIYKSNEKFFFF